MALSSVTHRRPGLHAPAYVVERLKRFHPQVSLAWDAKEECWALVAHDNFGAHTVIKRLKTFLRPAGPNKKLLRGQAEAPTLANTVWYLDRCDSRRWENESMKRQWLEELDSQGPHDEVKRSEDMASGRIEEGADRMWRLAGKRIPLAVKPSRDDSTDSAGPGRSSPTADG